MHRLPPPLFSPPVWSRLGTLLPGLLLLGACAQSPGAPAPEAAGGARFEVLVLGMAQDGGLPHLACERACCVEARASGEQRYPACLAVHDRGTGRLLLVEATPAVEAQVALLHRLTGAEGRGRKPVDAIMLTHAHIGHYLGLAQFGREVAGTQDLDVWVSPRFAEFLRQNGPWRQLVQLGQISLREFQPGTQFDPFPGLVVTPVQVPHRDEFSDTMAFVIRGPNRAVLFVPDVDRWDRAGGLLERLIDSVDIAYIDGSFYDGSELPDRNMSEIPHPAMVDTMNRLQARAREAPGAIRFIHLNHTNPALRDPALRARIEARGFRIAERGERVGI